MVSIAEENLIPAKFFEYSFGNANFRLCGLLGF